MLAFCDGLNGFVYCYTLIVTGFFLSEEIEVIRFLYYSFLFLINIPACQIALP